MINKRLKFEILSAMSSSVNSAHLTAHDGARATDEQPVGTWLITDDGVHNATDIVFQALSAGYVRAFTLTGASGCVITGLLEDAIPVSAGESIEIPSGGLCFTVADF